MEEARQAKAVDDIVGYLQVDQERDPQLLHLLQSIGLGLNKTAFEAVRQYRFKPGRLTGQFVTVEMNVEVTFHIY